MKKIVDYLKELYTKFVEDECSMMAGTISYFAFFSIFPAVMLLIGAFGYVIGYERAVSAVLSYIHSFIPQKISLIDDNLRGIVANSKTLGVIGLIGLVWAGSGIFGVLETGLNRICRINKNRGFVNQKLMSFSMLLIGGLVVVVSVAFRTAALTIEFIPKSFPLYGFLKNYSSVSSLVSSIILFGLIYYIVPNENVGIRRIWKGTVLAGLVFEVFKLGFIWYLSSGLANYERVYGSIGTVIVFLLWINISANILLVGAEINALTATSNSA